MTSIGGTCGTASGDNATVSWVFSAQNGSAACSGGVWTSGTFGTAITAEGTYSAQVSQGDAAGNTGTDSKNVTIDKTAPVVTLTSVNGSAQTFPFSTNSNVTTVGGACGSLTGDSSTINVTVTGTSSQSGTATCSSNAWTYTMSPALSAEGPYTVTATQGDAAGNTGTSGSKSITVDKTAPLVAVTQENGSTVTFPLSTNTNITSIGGTCGTLSGDSTTVSLTVNASPTVPATATCTSGNWTLTLTTAISAEGSYAFVASQSDAAGNTGTSTSKTVTVTRRRPLLR